jgi:hypothetical protein
MVIRHEFDTFGQNEECVQIFSSNERSSHSS